MAEVNRRAFLTFAAGVCAACALGESVHGAAATQPAAAAEGVDIGTLGDYAKDGISDRFAKQHAIMVVRHDGKLYAVSNRCTHKGAAINIRGDGFLCPKHNSTFSIEGTVTQGKASSTLPRYPIHVNDQGKLIVDVSTPLREKQFDQENAFVKVADAK